MNVILLRVFRAAGQKICSYAGWRISAITRCAREGGVKGAVVAGAMGVDVGFARGAREGRGVTPDKTRHHKYLLFLSIEGKGS